MELGKQGINPIFQKGLKGLQGVEEHGLSFGIS